MITNLLTIMISIFLSIKLSGCRGVVVACPATILEVVSSNPSRDDFSLSNHGFYAKISPNHVERIVNCRFSHNFAHQGCIWLKVIG